MMYKVSLLISLLCLGSCTPSSLSEFRKEGEAQVKNLIYDLQKIQGREDLAKNGVKLKQRFDKLAQLMIAARRHQKNHPDDEVPELNPYLNERLVAELKRIYRLEGGREAIEKAQHEAMIKISQQDALLAG